MTNLLSVGYEEHCHNFMNRWDVWALQCTANFALGLAHSIGTIANQSLVSLSIGHPFVWALMSCDRELHCS